MNGLDLAGLDLAGLARKLAEQWRLDGPQRRSLPVAGLPASAFVEAVRVILRTSPWYPSVWPRDAPAYDGAVITPNELGFIIHERYEIGMMRFSDATITQVTTLEEAVREFVRATFKGNEIDGIPIDWSC